MPTYGQNDGYYRGIRPNATKLYDLHQYTSRGRLPGYQGNLDLSRLASDKPISFFSSGLKPSKSSYQVGDSVVISGIYASSDSMTKLKPLYSQGVITKILVGKPNPYLLNKGMGWVNQSVMEPSRTQSRYQVKSGETLSEVAQKLGLSWQYLAKINDLANPNLIYPGQWLNY